MQKWYILGVGKCVLCVLISEVRDGKGFRCPQFRGVLL